MSDSKVLFDYWRNQVQLRNLSVIASPEHIQTYRLRHDCTNYDDLWQSQPVQLLDEPERSQVITVIKYTCTAQVLQRRAGILKDRIAELQTVHLEAEQKKSKLLHLIRVLQEKLFGKDQEIQKLRSRISILEAQNRALQAQAENDKAYTELLQAFDKLKQRKQELAKNNQRLGGRVAHTNRFRNERDAARAEVQALRQQLAIAAEDRQRLSTENAALSSELSQFRQRSRPKIVEIRRNGTSKAKD